MLWKNVIRLRGFCGIARALKGLNLALVIPCIAVAGWLMCEAFLAAAPDSSAPAESQIAPAADRLALASITIDTEQPAKSLIELAQTVRPRCRCIIQFDGALDDDQRAKLDSCGIELVEYISQDSFVARVEGAIPEKLREIEFVKWQSEFEPEWKIDPELGLRPYQATERQQLARDGIVLAGINLFEDATDQEIDSIIQLVQASPGAEVYWWRRIGKNPFLAVRMAKNDLLALAHDPAVQFIEDAPEYVDRNNTVRGIVQSNSAASIPVYNAGLHGEGEIIAVMDSGLDPNHCSFNDPGKILHYNSTTTITTHGTHVTGTAAGDNGAFDNTRGVAYASQLVFRVRPAYTETDIVTALELHHSQGARVHTNSWGNDLTNAYDGLARGIDSFAYDNEESLVIFAVSNGSTAKNPESSKNLLAVGATARSPNTQNFCSGGTGPTFDGRRKPEIFAPGCSTTSSGANTACSTVTMTGTSMAAPAIAGSAALTRQYFMSGFYPTGAANPSDAVTPSGALLKAALLNSAVDMTGIGGYPSNQEGWGRVLLTDVLFFSGDARKLIVRDVRNDQGIATGSTIEQPFVVNSNTQKLKVTLAWTEPPAAPGAGVVTVNDLDLELVAPNATVYLGNVFSGGLSVAGGMKDSINNVEQIHLNSPAAGTWTARIVGGAVNEGLQGFALVITGDVTDEPEPLSIIVTGQPNLVSPGSDAAVAVRIEPGDEMITPGSPTLHYRLGPGAYLQQSLTHLGGDMYEGMLPTMVCGDEPEYYVSAEGSSTGSHTSPHAAPADTYQILVGDIEETIIFAEDFEAGLPAEWSASGLWHVTGACAVNPVCDGSQWAYYGIDGSCNFSTGTTNSGLLQSGSIILPDAHSIRMTYCSSLQTENFSGADEASALASGSVLERPILGPELIWETRELDLTRFAGQTINLQFSFDTKDSFANGFHGWQVDNIRIYASELVCPIPPCVGDADGNNTVDVNDITFIVFRLGEVGGPADVDGSGSVDVNDISFVVFRLGTCP